jgi:hypothetical protein
MSARWNVRRVPDHRCGFIDEAPHLGTQVGKFNREAVVHMSNDLTHDFERRVLDQQDIDADLGPKTGLDRGLYQQCTGVRDIGEDP